MATQLRELLEDDAIITLGGCEVGKNRAYLISLHLATGARIIAWKGETQYSRSEIEGSDFWGTEERVEYPSPRRGRRRAF